jgi:hypothetical protein
LVQEKVPCKEREGEGLGASLNRTFTHRGRCEEPKLRLSAGLEWVTS